MSDTRQALEEAFKTVFPPPPNAHLGIDVPALEAHTQIVRRFRRFLDAEAWTDAAMMLIPDNWTAWEMRSHAARSHFSADLSRLSECDAGQEDWAHGRGMHPALALAEAALRAKEDGNG